MRGKDNVIPFSSDWVNELTQDKKPEAKARKALADIERKHDVKLVSKRRVPAIGWASPTEKLLTLEQVAEHFCVSVDTIRRAEARGELIGEPCGKNGRKVRFSRASIDAYKTFLASRRHG